jgi:hypothetical protein
MEKGLQSYSTKEKIYFFIHLLAVLVAWTGPFLFSWKIMIPLYFLISAQFIIFKSCLMNKHHGLDESDDHTFYAELFELLGFQPNRRKLKKFIRGYLHVILAIITLIWQLGLKIKPLLF